MQKRGQVTMFVLIGMVLVIFTSLIFYLMQFAATTNADSGEFDKAALRSYVTSCLKMASQDGLVVLGKQGGFINLKEPYLHDRNIGYLHQEGESYVPEIDEIEDELSDYVEAQTIICLNDFADFKAQNIAVQMGEPEIKAIITKKDVAFIMKLPITMTKNSKQIMLDKFENSESLDFMTIYETASNIVDSQVEHELIDLDEIMGDLEIKFFPYNHILMASLVDDSYMPDGQPYQFRFAN